MLRGVRSDDQRDYGTPYDFAEYIDRYQKGLTRSHYPIEMIIAMSRNAEERSDAGISATMLLDCPRKVILAEEEDFYEFPADFWARFRGSIGHLMMEYYGEDDPDVIREVRVRKYINVDGVSVEITGKSDKINTRDKLIVDYKSIKAVPDKPKPTHEPQVNIYRWLWDGGVRMDTGEQVSVEIERGGIVYFDMEKVVKLPVSIWPLEQIEQFIIDKLRPHVRYQQEGVLPSILYNEGGRRSALCNYCALKQACDARGR